MSGSYYSANPHHARPDRSEERERQESAENSAFWYFKSSTKRQKAAFDAAMARAATLNGGAHHVAKQAAHEAWHSTTADARALYEETVAEILRTGEVSEETGDRWQEVEDAAEARARAATIMAQFDAAISSIKAA
ncbi:hypothetical protein ACQR1I_16670 [Bradyrhizobium sp. HKCCYLS2038]|uniref:hypothetical protein n=1 Tax=unclassified Bradyrhizobium TaxID=2631580 RepID=UPI003EC00685